MKHEEALTQKREVDKNWDAVGGMSPGRWKSRKKHRAFQELEEGHNG